ncbi:MAG: importin-alpha export receptor [Trizodia sp. TS-e1964]|nr:MAG: importin-alpha export receptor [Trizodia sp. TS-e1964]
MAASIQSVVKLLEATLDATTNKEATNTLQSQETNAGFSLLLLQIIASNGYPQMSRNLAAIYFKNFLRRNWVDVDGNHLLSSSEIGTIKRELLGLMLAAPQGIQAQIGEAISVIAESDFWERWDTLTDDFVSRLTPNDAALNNAILQVAHSIYRRWRPLYRSDKLFTEINHVAGKFCAPLLTLFANTDQMIEGNQKNADELKKYFETLILVIQVFHDISCQDLPPGFEDNLRPITTLLLKYLTYDNPLLHTSDDTEVGILERVKAEICDVLILYVQKYEDAINLLLGDFITSSWTLLTTIGPETKYDIMVSKALQFLTAITHMIEHAQKFNSEEVMGQVVERVILPNISLRESDVEIFEDEPFEFIRKDLEGSDGDTRRRAATDFLRQLMEKLDGLTTKVVSNYINHYLTDYAGNPQANWKSKDTAVYLFSSIAAKGVVTASQGVTATNPYVNVVEFFEKNLAEDLISDQVYPILKVDAIKFLYQFRGQMTKPQWHDVFPLLIKHLASSNYVVYSYVAIAVERLLVLTNESKEPILTKQDVMPMAKDLLEHLFHLIEKNPASESVQENEYLMKCVMRVLFVIKQGVSTIAPIILAHLVTITKVISGNPSNPRFYYYLFEAIGAFIKFTERSQVQIISDSFVGPFADIITHNVEEFVPYVLQIYALLLEVSPPQTLPSFYEQLMQVILSPKPWEKRGNTPALVRLLSAMVTKASSLMVNNTQVEPILGIFQKLVSSKASEAQAFDLLECIICNFPASALEKYFVVMFNIILTRLQNSKTETFSQRFVRFYHLMAARDKEGLGADAVVKITDQIQDNLFAGLYTSVILQETQKFVKPFDRKIAVVSFTKTLADSNAFAVKYKKGWSHTCEALLKLMENPPVPTATEDILPDKDFEDLSFGASFTQLNTCRKPVQDFWPEVTDVKKWVALYLKDANNRHNGMINTFVGERLSEEAKHVLLSYMQ